MLRMRGKPHEEPELDPNAERKAVALKYDQEKNIAPKLVAKGRGHVAENILNAAQQNSIPVYQNKSLVNMLMAMQRLKKAFIDLLDFHLLIQVIKDKQVLHR